MSGGVRAKRVAEAIRTHLAESIHRDLGDPRLSDIVVTSVTVTDDLGVARVRVRRLTGEVPSGEPAGVMAALERASGRLRRRLGPAVGLRRVPELRFSYDAGQDAARRVEELLDEIRGESGTGD